MLVLEIRDPSRALQQPLQPAEQTWHSQGASQEGVDGAWSFRLFVLLSMAITSGLSLLGKGCQQVRSCFPNSDPFLPFPAFVCLFPLFSSSSFPFPFAFSFSLFPFPLLLLSPSPFSFPASLLRRGERMPLSPLCPVTFSSGIQHLQHIPAKAACQHYQFSSFLPLLAPGSTSTFLI